MVEDNNKKDARERNENAKKILKVKNIKTEEEKVYGTGAAAFSTFFNSLVDEVVTKAQKEADKPRYRFLEDMPRFIACQKISETAVNDTQRDIKEKLGRVVIINQKTMQPAYFDVDLNLILREGESYEDIVERSFINEKQQYEHIQIDKENRTYNIKNIDNIEFVPVRKFERGTVFMQIDELEKKLHEYKYGVKVCEDLDCTNVTEESRYYIRVSKDNGIFIDIDLLKYEENIKDFTFNEQDYIESMICRIEGSNSSATKIIAGYIADYLAHIIYFREFYTLVYNKIGWDYYDWDRTGWIFKYDKIYSTIGLLRGEARDNCAEGLDCKKEMLDIEQSVMSEYNKDLYETIKDCAEGQDDEKELSQEEKDALIEEKYGEEFEWIRFTRMLINTHPYDALILGAGISGLIRQLLPYTKENNININIVGEPASGKSTICHYLLGIFGKPEKLEGSFTDTANSMEQIRIKRPILPYVLDERMLRIEGESEKAKSHTILMDIFREYEGKVKERLGKQYEETAGERTYGPIISSSVKSMMDYVFESDDLGQYRRFMEFDIGTQRSATLFKDDKEAKRAESIAYKNYGYGIRIIVDYMLELLHGSDKDANVIIERFERLDELIENLLTEREGEEDDVKVKGLSSSSKRFALIVLSYQILREALNHYDKKILTYYRAENYDEIVELIEKKQIDNTEEIIKLLIDNLVLKMKKVKHKADATSDNNLYNYILNNMSCFKIIDKNMKLQDAANEIYNAKDKYLGFIKIDKENNEIELSTIMLYQLDQFWYMDDIPQPKVIFEYIKEVDEQGLDANADALEFGVKNYNTNSSRAQLHFKDSKSQILGRRNYPIEAKNGKTEDFHKKVIKYVKPTDEEKKVGES